MAAKEPIPKVVDQVKEANGEAPKKRKAVPPEPILDKEGKPVKFIKVQADLPENQIGFIGDRGGSLHHRRRNGDIFVIREDQFSKKWMKLLSDRSVEEEVEE